VGSISATLLFIFTAATNISRFDTFQFVAEPPFQIPSLRSTPNKKGHRSKSVSLTSLQFSKNSRGYGAHPAFCGADNAVSVVMSG